MPDDLDTRLRDAGAAWRADHPDAVDARPPTTGRRGRLPAVAAAVVLVALVVAGVVALRGDRDESRPASTPIAGTVWRLDGGGFATFVVQDGQLVADDACTLISGRANLRDGILAVSGLTTRAKSCADSVGEATFDDIFTATLELRVDGDKLTLRSGGRTVKASRADLPAPTLDYPTFTDTNWKIIAVRRPDGTSLAPRRAATLVVHAGNRLAAEDGCNGIGAELKIDGERVTPTREGTTLVGCGEAAATVVIDQVLARPFRQTVAGSRLTITSSAGTLVYEWVPKDVAAHDVSRLVGPTWRLTSAAGELAAGLATLRFPTETSYEFRAPCGTSRGRAQITSATFVLSGVRSGCEGQLVTVTSFLSGDVAWRIADGRLIVGGSGAQALALVLTAGAAAPADPLVGSWQFTGEASVSLSFDGRRFEVLGTCASRQGTYRLEGSTLHIAGGGRACRSSDDAAAIEDLLLSPGPINWSVHERTLTLTRDGSTLTFER